MVQSYLPRSHTCAVHLLAHEGPGAPCDGRRGRRAIDSKSDVKLNNADSLLGKAA